MPWADVGALGAALGSWKHLIKRHRFAAVYLDLVPIARRTGLYELGDAVGGMAVGGHPSSIRQTFM
jgi:hypothetical protein